MKSDRFRLQSSHLSWYFLLTVSVLQLLIGIFSCIKSVVSEQDMQNKMDSNLKYFIAISENKRKEVELKGMETKIDDLKKKMLTRYWKDKISVFDEMIRLNVKTPSYDFERSKEENDDRDNKLTLGPMAIDSKLLSGKPVSLQRGNKPGSRIEPVINIEGTDAVCYPNKEAKRGRKVGLNLSVLRRMEQCKALEESIASIRCKSAARREDSHTRRNALDFQRPKTAPKLSGKSKSLENENRPGTSPAGISTEGRSADETKRRPSTSLGSFKREAYISTPIYRRSSTSLSSNSRNSPS